MKKWIPFFIVVVILIAGFWLIIQQTQWQHVYTNGYGGEPRYGSLQALIQAIRSGKDVKIELDQGTDYLIYVPAQNIWIKGGHVYALNTSAISLSCGSDKLSFNPDTYHWWLLVDTKGKLEMIRFTVGTGKSQGHDQRRVSVRWFVR
ncbi:MAG: hypothetical protein K8S27_04150 [Candidatus Omnitrophica bacterium]|nr:hypothetical protein [Candidatus Omnitrophota bacterium]